jgi:GH24 family phage-related lysozyme (muramidase)
MANRRLEPVSYRPFRVEPTLADGLLAVPRDGGELERKVAMGMARMADEAGRKADLQAQRAGAQAGARDGMAGAPTADTITGGQVTGTASVNGQAGHVRGAQGGTRVYTGDAAAQVKALLRNEEGFREKPYWDVNAWRVGYGSDTVTDASGRSVKVTPGMTVTREDAERDLDYRLTSREGAQVRRQVGDAWGSLAPNVQAALYSVGYNYGSLPDEVVSAVKSGDLSTIASAVGGLSSNKDRRAREAAMIGGGSFQQLPSPSSVAPISVTPVMEPVTIEQGKAGTFRPSGRDTVYGRAYDVAGERTYLEMADAAMVENQTALFDAYGDNPAMLEKALGEGLTADLRDNVFDEIAPEYEVAYRKRATALMSKARVAEKERAAQVNRAAFLTRAEQLETQRAQRMAGMDANDPAAASDLAGLQASIDAHYDSAVARGVMDADAAATAKKNSRSEMTVGFYVGQTAKMPADLIDAMHAEMRQHFADGALEGVTGSEWAEIDKGLAAAAATRRTQDENATSSLKTRGEAIVNKIARGQAIAPDELTRFQMDIGTATNGKQIAASTYARMRVADALRKQPIGEVERDLEKILKGGGDSVDPEDTAFARKTIAEFRQAVLTDPLGKAEAIGLIPPVPGIPVDGTASPEEIADAVSYRRGAADAVAKHFGVSPRYFRPGEADAVMRAAEANPEALVSFTQSVRDAFGKDAHKALSEFSESGPTLAHAAGLAIATGDVGIARDVATTLTMKRNKQLQDLQPETVRKLNSFGANAIAGAFMADPRTQNAALQTAQLLFENDAARLGIDPADIKTEGSPAQTAYLKALDRALGGRTVNGESFGGMDEVNGFPIITPAEMMKGEPQALLEELTSAQLKALPPIFSSNDYPITADRIRQGALVSAGDGLYRVALGDPTGDEPRYLVRDDGTPWVLDIRKLQEASAAEPEPTGRRGYLRRTLQDQFNPEGAQ